MGIIRKSFGLKNEILPQLEANYYSSLVEEIKRNDFTYHEGRLTFYLAREFGFCYGVDRAVAYAYETRKKFPDRRIFITNEIIHNPQVNRALREMGIQFLSGPYAEKTFWEELAAKDIVMIPAFGTTLEELARLEAKGCVLVDTTCGSVMSVWKRVEAYSREGFTSVIHGKYNHEETRATCSRAIQPGGKYVVVRDQFQTGLLCDYFLGRASRSVFMGEFEPALSPGFNPDEDLQKIGCANQTTMLSTDSLEIARMLEDAIRKKFGDKELASRFRSFDTVCSATQERQDAVYELIKKQIDLMLVVGGLNSSNTGHLAEIASRFCPTYHIDDASCILSHEKIRFKKPFDRDVVEAEGWLPDGPLKIGITAGASTPNRMIEDVILRMQEITAPSPE